MKVELLDVLEEIERTAESYDRISGMYKKDDSSDNYVQFSTRASTLRILADELEKIYPIEIDPEELPE